MIINPADANTEVGPSESSMPSGTTERVSLASNQARSLALPLYLLAALAILAALYAARVIAFPIVLGFMIAFPLRPVVRWLYRRGLPHVVGAFLVMSIVGVVLVAGTVLIVGPASRWFNDAPAKFREAEYKLRTWSEPWEDLGAASKQVEKIAKSTEDSETIKVSVQQPSLMSTVLSTTGNLLLTGMVAFSLTFLLLAFGDNLLKSIASLVHSRYRQGLSAGPTNVQEVCECIEQTISRYLLTHSAINIGLGVVIGTGLWLIGMPNALLWGVMACLLNYVPFVGLITGTLVVSLVALLSFDSLLYASLAPLIYLGANGIEINLVSPALLGRAMKLNVVIVFLSVVVWGWMWGIGGAILAVPMLAVIKIICTNVVALKPVATLVSGESTGTILNSNGCAA